MSLKEYDVPFMKKAFNLFKSVDAADASPQAGDRLELEIKGVMVAFRYCPPGTFLMGTPENEKNLFASKSQHEVTLTRGFWLGETPVTQRFWKAVTGSESGGWFEGLDARPATNFCMAECHKFIENLNDLGVAPSDMKFDLPTETEWEYACRAGTTTAYNVGVFLTEEDANFSWSGFKETTPVRSYAPNAWGFYDMHGNVWEWCKDRLNPPSEQFADFAIRGGCYTTSAEGCRSDSRYSAEEWGDRNVGFRLALRSAE